MTLFYSAYLYFSYALFFIAINTARAEQVIVETELGKVAGYVLEVKKTHRNNFTESHVGKRAQIFLGIPYAKAPIGKLRFEKPRSLDPWQPNILNATKPGPTCWPYTRTTLISGSYFFPGKANYSEACLVLNIIAPELGRKGAELMPVLFFIHGGGFEAGSILEYKVQPTVNNYAARDLVSVFVEYRQGILGFGSNGQSDFPGNNGLWDICAALEFIQKIIHNFGGDKNRITVWGNSAGAGSTSAFTISTKTQKLFQQAIQLSGTVFAGWSFNQGTVNSTLWMARIVNCSDFAFQIDGKALKNCLRTVPIDKFLAASVEMGFSRPDAHMLLFMPRLDGDFFVKDPVDLISMVPPKPSLAGFTNIDTHLYTAMMRLDVCWSLYIGLNQTTFDAQNYRDYVKRVIAPTHLFKSRAKEKFVQEEISEFYLNYKYTNENQFGASCENCFVKRASDTSLDIQMSYPMIWESRLKSSYGWPVYMYLMTHYNPEFYPKQLVNGSVHAQELSYLFDLDYISVIYKFSDSDLAHRKILLDMVEQFAKTRHPGFNWPRVKATGPLDFVVLNTKAVPSQGLWEDRMHLWDRIRKLTTNKTSGFDLVRGQIML